MKLKLDENLGHRARALLVAAGHDVATVHEENLSSASDDEVIRASRQEGDLPQRIPPRILSAFLQYFRPRPFDGERAVLGALGELHRAGREPPEDARELGVNHLSTFDP